LTVDFLDCSPQPTTTIIILDQAEELMRKFRGKFLVKFYSLAKEGRDNDTFRLVLIINTENAVVLLKLLNGGNMFEIVRAPMVSKDAVTNYLGEDFAQIFEDCNSCIGVAQDFVTEKPSVSAKEFFNTRKQQYEQNNCLLRPISRAEYNKLTTEDPDDVRVLRLVTKQYTASTVDAEIENAENNKNTCKFEKKSSGMPNTKNIFEFLSSSPSLLLFLPTLHSP
jgi:hypothetical protein